jgi:hypothetical protein
MSFLRSNLVTSLAIVVIVSITTGTLIGYQDWNNDNKIIEADVKGYYAYLPALFINDDLAFDNLDVYDKGESDSYVWVDDVGDGKKGIKYSYGMALAYSPFFLMAHGYASLTEYEANGFTTPYRVSLVLSSVFFLIIGLIYLGRFLLLHFDDRAVAISLIILYLGTNLFNYYTDEPAMSHGYSMALISMFLYYSHMWLEAPKLKYSVIIGLSFGLLVLIRPIDILFGLFFLLYQVASLTEFKARISLLLNRITPILIIALFGLLVFLPHFLYLNFAYGGFFSYSYKDEGFFFLQPRILDALFSYRNGWLLYSPIMLLSIGGIWTLYRSKRKLTSFVLITSVLYIYVISSWWCWWYSGFGNRAFINLYPILALGLTSLISLLLSKKLIARIVFKSTVLVLIVFSLFQSYKFRLGSIHWTSMTKEAYWSSFTNTRAHPLNDLYLQQPDYDLAMKGVDAVYVPHLDTIRSFELDKSNWEQGTMYALNYKFEITDGSHIVGSFWAKSKEEFTTTLSKTGGAPFYQGLFFPVERDGDWTKIMFYSPVPSDGASKEYILYLLPTGKSSFGNNISIKNLEVHEVNQELRLQKKN